MAKDQTDLERIVHRHQAGKVTPSGPNDSLILDMLSQQTPESLLHAPKLQQEIYADMPTRDWEQALAPLAGTDWSVADLLELERANPAAKTTLSHLRKFHGQEDKLPQHLQLVLKLTEIFALIGTSLDQTAVPSRSTSKAHILAKGLSLKTFEQLEKLAQFSQKNPFHGKAVITLAHRAMLAKDMPLGLVHTALWHNATSKIGYGVFELINPHHKNDQLRVLNKADQNLTKFHNAYQRHNALSPQARNTQFDLTVQQGQAKASQVIKANLQLRRDVVPLLNPALKRLHQAKTSFMPDQQGRRVLHTPHYYAEKATEFAAKSRLKKDTKGRRILKLG